MHPVERAKLLAREEREAAAVLHDYEEENRHILRQQATLKNIRQKAYTKKINFRKKLIWYICDCGKTAPAIGKTLLSPEELKEIDNLLGIDSERSTVGVRSNCHCSVCQERQGKVDKLISDIRKEAIERLVLGTL